MGNGTAVQEAGLLYESELALGKWYRSKDKKQIPRSDFPSFMMNKKWWLEEEFNVHMMRFQQVKSRYLLIKKFYIFNARLVCSSPKFDSKKKKKRKNLKS